MPVFQCREFHGRRCSVRQAEPLVQGLVLRNNGGSGTLNETGPQPTEEVSIYLYYNFGDDPRSVLRREKNGKEQLNERGVQPL
ncbi:hypothetical protein NPIL_157271 [Nephila pilipes]|uniref:Uncharacterized protein n=1 Tax=Nephila pilipes TaxID=299642 RepID=A0A8X6I342_NEPPI|nr:hypothetical protein NPIL_157271 [Nephila pilipes]